MSLNHLLQDLQNKAIEDKYSEYPLFCLLRFVATPMMADAKQFAIFPGELFYNCVFSLDQMKGLSYHTLKESATLLWSKIVLYFKDKGYSIDNQEVFKAAALLTYSISCALLVAKDGKFIYASEIISNYLTELNPTISNTIRKRFSKALKTIGEAQLHSWMNEYLASNDFLSTDIEKIIDENTVIEKKNVRKIDSERLSTYFTASFRGIGSGERTNFFDYLLENLKSDFTEPEWCQIAVMIYNSKTMNSQRPRTFKKWYKIFSEMVECTYKENREPRKNQPNEEIKRIFHYL